MRDQRNYVVTVILMICIVIMLMTIVASANRDHRLSARSAVLYEPFSQTFLFDKNSDIKLPMASTTKIMTGLIAIEETQPDDIVVVGKESVGIEGSSIYLKEGDTISCRDLIYSLLLQSANDAAVALATKISGDVSGFAELMNKRAREIGLYNTHFDNPHGLDSKTHYTTAKDLAILSSVALDNPTFRDIVSTYKYSFNISDKTRTVVNHNKMLKRYDGCIGVKTGFTKKCGRCLVSSAERDGVRLIAVTLDAPDDWNDHTVMLNEGFSEFEAVPLKAFCKTEFSIPVIASTDTHIYAAIEDQDAKIIKRRDSDNIKCTVDVRPYLVAPVKIGDKVGDIICTKDGKVLAQYAVLASSDAKPEKKFNLFDIFSH